MRFGAGFSERSARASSSTPAVPAALSLANEHAGGGQAMAGAVLQLSKARVAAEYNAATVRTISLKVGFGR